MMRLLSMVLLIAMGSQAAGVDDPLTADGLRAWLSAGGMFESNARLVHTQMQQQRASLPPWWPDDVYAQEEQALQKVDFVEAALPFYQACLTDTQARLLAKVTLSQAGQKIAQTALDTHSRATVAGADSTTAQTAGEDAAAKKASSLSTEEKQRMAATLTPAERALAAKTFTPAKLAIFCQCADSAYAKTTEILKMKQEEAVRAVIAANRPRLAEAKTQWTKEHPGKAE